MVIMPAELHLDCEPKQNEEPLDPRIQAELETLNQASLLINKLENEMQRATQRFNRCRQESTSKLSHMSRKLGPCIEKAQPYYDARLRVKELTDKRELCLNKYDISLIVRDTAREMIAVAEEETQKLRRHKMNPAWLETINAANQKLYTADENVSTCKEQCDRTCMDLEVSKDEVEQKYKSLKKYIKKSKSYYETKAKYHQLLDEQKQAIEKRKNETDKAKLLYSRALAALERISGEIHARRKSEQTNPLNNNDQAALEDRLLHPVSQDDEIHTSTPRSTRLDDRGSPTELGIERLRLGEDESAEAHRRNRSVSFPVEYTPPSRGNSREHSQRHERTNSLQSSSSDSWESSTSGGSVSSLNKSSSSILGDDEVQACLRGAYFGDTDTIKLPVCKISEEEYCLLPPELSAYQSELNSKRQSTLKSDPNLSLSNVIKMLAEEEEIMV